MFNIHRFCYSLSFVFSGLVLWCNGIKFRQVLGYLPSSQIPGTCNLQACCCCGDLNMGVNRVTFQVFPALWILNITDMVIAFIFLFCFISATFVYYKIYFAVRRHTNEIQALQVQQLAQNGNVMANVARLSKSAVSTFYVYLVLLVCYLPGYGIFVAKIISSEPSTARKGLSLYTSTLVFLNSSLNPIIYCFKMRHIRHAVVDILRKIFTSRK